MRLTNVLNRCAAVVRAAARRVGQSLGRLGRTVTRTVVRAIAPAMSTLRTRLGRLATVALPVLAVGCREAPAGPAVAPQALAVTAEPVAAIDAPTPVDAAVDAPPQRPIGEFLMTFYYVAAEEAPPSAAPAAVVAPAPAVATTAPVANDNATPSPANDNAPSGEDVSLAASAAPPRVTLLDRGCQPLVEVSASFAAQIRMQGTGRLRDGRLVNVAGACSCGQGCFHILPAGIKWGRGAWGLPMTPFRMVAVDPTVIPLGTLLYVPELDGRRMPGRPPGGGFVHDGCVVAADVGGGIKGRQLDLFVAHRAYYVGLAQRGSSHAWASKVEVWDGSARCTRRGMKVSRSAAGSI
jgi:3D (Asp-Asp-Asp) domain-containing protein